jgi:Raf kinase inhibitor-like YbhB/YbcL family protein
MRVSSTSFDEGQEIPQRYGKDFENVSPQLSWSDAPPDSRSFAVSAVDRDPVAANFVHWLVVDIDAAVTSLQEGASSAGMPSRAREVTPYIGPFPPAGTHDYEFTVYALGTEQLELPRKASLEAFADAVEPHLLASAKMVGRFSSTRG